MVAPHAGAWIETLLACAIRHQRVSRAPRGARGLKHDLKADDRGDARVAPHAGAWIETRIAFADEPRLT